MWVDGAKTGQGVLILAKDDKYEGEYEGEFKDDKYHGQGTLSLVNGIKYIGSWLNGAKDRGVLTLANGDKYEGEFKDDMFHGVGTFIHFNGSIYIGQWRYGKKMAKGRLL